MYKSFNVREIDVHISVDFADTVQDISDFEREI